MTENVPNQQAQERTHRDEDNSQSRIPSITLPKGGGALRAIDEKFSVNAANGTCQVSVALPFSSARSGIGVSLNLHYNSGSGNGPFGLGWSLDLPSIQRRTDKQLPRYMDDLESDVFIFSGGEDLVPTYVKDSGGHWTPDGVTSGSMTVERYRPRLEGGFARVEKIHLPGEPACYWKVTTRENVTTIFGRSHAARITHPTDSSKVFRWLPEWAFDDKGNCVEYVYKQEDLANIPDLVEEKHRRSGLAPIANLYLKRIRYGNKNPYFPDPGNPFTPSAPTNAAYFFEAVLDYGEHAPAAPTPNEITTWPCRYDPFSDYRAGFEIRTYRLCKRVLFFHSFTELEFSPAPYLVKSLDLSYRYLHFDNAPYTSREVDYITSIQRANYRKTGADSYTQKAWPALDLNYQELNWNTAVQEISPDDVVGAPGGVSLPAYQWVDLYGEGISGILSEQSTGWYYKSNLGDGHFSRAAAVLQKPSLTGVAATTLQFQDLDANGVRQLVSLSTELRGFFELTDENEWLPFRLFTQLPNVNFGASESKLIDLDGDGKPDLLIAEELAFRVHSSLGTQGFDAPLFTTRSFDEEQGPARIFGDDTQALFTADMNGDGLSEIVRVRNGEVCYWPNLGYGHFGAKVTMRNAPRLDFPEHFDPGKIQLAEISGTGAADLIYLDQGGFTAWINFSGNTWSDAQEIKPFPSTETPNRVSVIDLLGNGTVAVVWSSELPASGAAPLRYVDLMGGNKPYVISNYQNNLGMQVKLQYKSSSHFMLLDKSAGKPWATKLPFPSMCVSRVETTDSVSGSVFVQEYRYRHGYYDHTEREFRGFGMVEQRDTETFEKFAAGGGANLVDSSVHQPPVRTRTWYHTGAFITEGGILQQFAGDYYRNPSITEDALPDAVLEAESRSPEEQRQAARACKGMVLRQEVYADDDSLQAAIPYSTAEHNCHIRMLQPMLGNRYAVFLATESEAITYHYERDPADPRIAHTLNTEIDKFANVRESAIVVYGRSYADTSLPPEVQAEQARIRITYTQHAYTNDVFSEPAYRVRLLCETKAFELTGVRPAASYFTPDEIRSAFHAASPLGFEQQPHTGVTEKRLIQQQRTLFARNTDVNLPLPLGSLESLGLHYEMYKLAFTPSLLTALYGAKVNAAMLTEGAYLKSDDYKASGLFPVADDNGDWWTRTGTVQYPSNPDQHFYLPERYLDPFGNPTTVRYYSDYHLLIDRTTDALGNQINVENFDFRTLQRQRMRDINDNISEVSIDILGLVVGTALLGKGKEADDLVGFQPDLTQAEIDAFLLDPVTNGPGLLQHATSCFIYNLQALPVVAASIVRETHYQDEVSSGIASRLQCSFEYSDGLGHIAMKKVQAEPGKANQVVVHGDGTYTVTVVETSPNLRWTGSGRTVVNNKDKPVMQYEPYFSVTPAYEDAKELVETGVTPVFIYDPAGRLIRTDFPDRTFSRVEFDAWKEKSFDRNDTVLASDWYAARIGGALGLAEKSAAQKAALHDNTPATHHSDSLGHSIYTVEHNKFINRTTSLVQEEFYNTLSVHDISGNPLSIKDPRGNVVMQYFYDNLSRQATTLGMDGGQRWALSETTGKALYGWSEKGDRFHVAYDPLRRPTQHEVLTIASGTSVYKKAIYGSDKTKNLNGKVILQFDKSGRVTYDVYDINGNIRSAGRTFTAGYQTIPDWSNPPTVVMQATIYTTQTAYDALNRPLLTTSADQSVTTVTYSEAGLLTSVGVGIRGAATQPFLSRIAHNAKGQRERITYANGVVTTFGYDPQTFRVRRLLTTRTSDGASLQDLNYTYDPVGNITQVRDAAQQTVFFNGAVVTPNSDFTYDAEYRLVAAMGREHIGQNKPVSEFDEFRTRLPHPADGSALQRYLQQYDYDFAGNMLNMVHSSGSGPFTSRWTRHFNPAAASNRLDSSQVGATTENYSYDLHGNMTSLPGLPTVAWDFNDHLHSADLNGTGTAYYTYDAGGNRVRKVIERQGGIIEERLYLGVAEFFTRKQAAVIQLQRQSLHVMDGGSRLALVDSRTAGDDGTPSQFIRYQFSNHLGTSVLELDDTAQIISYEEYYSFGSTSFQSVDSMREVPARRYRYTGKERDEETGFYYHGARYYAPWLTRWTAADPEGMVDGANLYAYVRDNPIRLSDPTGTQGGSSDTPPFHFEQQPPGPVGHPSPGLRLVYDRPIFRGSSTLTGTPPTPPQAASDSDSDSGPRFHYEEVPPDPSGRLIPRLRLVYDRPVFPSFIQPRPTSGNPGENEPAAEPENIDLGGDLPNITSDATGNAPGLLVLEHRTEFNSERFSTVGLGRLGLGRNATLALSGGYSAPYSITPTARPGILGGAALRVWGTAVGSGNRRLDLATIFNTSIDTSSDTPVSAGATGAATLKLSDELSLAGNLGFIGAFGGPLGYLASLSFTSGPWNVEVARSQTYGTGGSERTTVGMNFRIFNGEGTTRAGAIYVNPFAAFVQDVGQPQRLIVGIGVTSILGLPIFGR